MYIKTQSEGYKGAMIKGMCHEAQVKSFKEKYTQGENNKNNNKHFLAQDLEESSPTMPLKAMDGFNPHSQEVKYNPYPINCLPFTQK